MNPAQPSLPRRDFIKNSACLDALAAAAPLANVASLTAAEPPPPRKSNGIQVGAVSFVDEGTETVLDLFQERGAIDTIYLTTFTYGRGLAGRQIPGHPFPDHGSQESDEKTFHGGNYATPHPEFYGDTVLKQTRAPDHGDLDIVATVLPAAQRRGMRVFCSIEDVFRETQRALSGVQGKCKVYPGIDIGIPTGKNSRKASPDDTFAAVAAALKAGADGLILSRKYSEMQLANLTAAGRAVRDFVKG